MTKKNRTALLSVYYKEGLEPLARLLHENGVKIYSTGGTQKFLEDLNIPCIPVEDLTSYPSILGGRVKTLHPRVFGGILGRREQEEDKRQMQEHQIPEIDLVIVNLYPFEETVKNTDDEKQIIEKIDIGGPSMIRAAAKNFQDVLVLSSPNEYEPFIETYRKQDGSFTLEQRKQHAAQTFEMVLEYDKAIADYFNRQTRILRYGENPHQQAFFTGNLDDLFEQLNGKEISYNNLVDMDAAIQLMNEFQQEVNSVFAIFKHTNVCGAAIRPSILESWQAALAGDPESAFGGILICNHGINKAVAESMHEIFFEVVIAPDYDEDALEILCQRKNRIILKKKRDTKPERISKTILGGIITQNTDVGNVAKWEESGARACTDTEKADLLFANTLCKHLKSNAITLVRDLQLIGKGCGQTSRIDALRQAISKAEQFNFHLEEAVMASDAFFPFDDCIQIAGEAGITACIQPGGSIRDKDSILYAKENNMAMVLTGMRHFRH